MKRIITTVYLVLRSGHGFTVCTPQSWFAVIREFSFRAGPVVVLDEYGRAIAYTHEHYDFGSYPPVYRPNGEVAETEFDAAAAISAAEHRTTARDAVLLINYTPIADICAERRAMVDKGQRPPPWKGPEI